MPVIKPCDLCGTPYQAKRASRYCSPACRNQASAARIGRKVVAAEPVVVESSVAAATRAELDAVGRADSVAGQAALTLAARIDAQAETGAALAALVKQLHATMAVATANTSESLDVLDELRARREARRGA